MYKLVDVVSQQIESCQLQQAEFVLAYSGGLDSTALLSLFAQLRTQQPTLKVRAAHIHHGLSLNADSWQQQCLHICEQFNIPFTTYKVQIDPHNTTNGIEADARLARYQVFKQTLKSNEVLVTAHHQDDQCETFFLALKRGAGIHGLAAMPVLSELFEIPLFRPLLEISRSQLQTYATQQALTWVEDESNQDNRYERNFLRNEILPQIKQRWPHFSQMVQRSTQLCSEQQNLLEELLATDLKQLSDQQTHTLTIDKFERFSRIKQQALLRFWLKQEQQSMPSRQQLDELIEKVIFARHDAQPQLQLGNKMIRRYATKIYLTPLFIDTRTWQAQPELNRSLLLPDNLGSLLMQEKSNKQLEFI